MCASLSPLPLKVRLATAGGEFLSSVSLTLCQFTALCMPSSWSSSWSALSSLSSSSSCHGSHKLMRWGAYVLLLVHVPYSYGPSCSPHHPPSPRSSNKANRTWQHNLMCYWLSIWRRIRRSHQECGQTNAVWRKVHPYTPITGYERTDTRTRAHADNVTPKHANIWGTSERVSADDVKQQHRE